MNLSARAAAMSAKTTTTTTMIGVGSLHGADTAASALNILLGLAGIARSSQSIVLMTERPIKIMTGRTDGSIARMV